MVAVSPRAEQIIVLLILNFASLSGAKTGGFFGMHWQIERALRVWGMGSFGATKPLEADNVQSTSSRFGSVTVSIIASATLYTYPSNEGRDTDELLTPQI